MKDKLPQCAKCPLKNCIMGFSLEVPNFCPMKTSPNVFEDARGIIETPEIRKMFRGVCTTWKDTKLSKNRIEEVMTYAGNMDFKKLGLVFCVGLSSEAEILSAIFERGGFEVVSVCCMAGGFTSDDVGLSEEDKVYSMGRQPQCNPVGQALLMNKYKTDLNILVGLCVGDDSIFIKNSDAPVTILAVKDRTCSHNPLSALPSYKESLKKAQ